MTNDQAQKGFKTFLLTLSVSLIIFSVIYYVITSTSDAPDLSADVEMDVETQVSQVPEPQAEAETVFGSLAARQVSGNTAVLAGTATGEDGAAAETTESTVPDSGIVGVTAGLIMSAAMFVGAVFVLAKNPRRLALSGFEKRVLKDLE